MDGKGHLTQAGTDTETEAGISNNQPYRRWTAGSE